MWVLLTFIKASPQLLYAPSQCNLAERATLLDTESIYIHPRGFLAKRKNEKEKNPFCFITVSANSESLDVIFFKKFIKACLMGKKSNLPFFSPDILLTPKNREPTFK